MASSAGVRRGMLAALDEARRSGHGQVVDAAIIDGTSHLMTMIYSCHAAGVWSDERGTNLGDGGSPFYGVYQTSDAKFMAVGALEPQFYAEFLRLLEVPFDPEAQFDRDAWPQLRTTIGAAFAARPQQDWAQTFSGSDAWHPFSAWQRRRVIRNWQPAKPSSSAMASPSRPRPPDSRGRRPRWTVHRACLDSTPTRYSPTG
jgi:crotonobetainyl-CoA:carnitine CoA-transferase CaiB-like acyl-CoA transferase